MKHNENITVVGTGSWGTTLAIIMAQKGTHVTLFARTQQESVELQKSRCSSQFLPNAALPDNIYVTSCPKEAFSSAGLIVLAVPCNTMRINANLIGNHLLEHSVILSASKGLEMETGKTMSSVLKDVLPKEYQQAICVLSGPNLASEILEGKPASAVAASYCTATALYVQDLMMSPRFRIYTNSDVIGVELGGALKNIIAIGAGICDGLSYGENSKSAFITRGLAEISRLGVACGADPSTLYGLTGLGDLIATCASSSSRNHWVGQQLAHGKRLVDILKSMRNIAEGVHTTKAAKQISDQLQVEMPITQVTYRILFESLEPRKAVADLLDRPPRPEY